MTAQRVAILVLLGAGCSDDSGSGAGSSDTGGTASGTGEHAETHATPTPADSSGGGQDGTASPTGGPTGETGDSEDSDETGGDTSNDSEGTETGEDPPAGSPGCMAATSLEEGEHQFMLDGLDRRYIVRLPKNYSPDTPWPLIFALHGNGGNPDYWDATGGDRDIRTAFGTEAILIIPEAINNAWRDYDAPSESWPAGIELELNYFDAMVEAAQNELCIDPQNIFSMGFSGGGSFSGVLGCRRDYIRAIAVGGSVIYFDTEACTATPAAWVTIGDGETSEGREAYRDFFRTRAGCEATSTPSEPGGCIAYDDCDAETPVTFCSHPAGHVWPSIGTDATRTFFANLYAAK